MGTEDRKQVWVTKEHYEQLNNPASIMQKPKGTGVGGCGLIEIGGSDGVRFECRGSCGFIDRFLGRSCNKVVQNAGGGVQVFCTCSGGWWDRLLRS